MQIKNRRINNFQISYKNDFETDFLLDEIFNEKPYFFSNTQKSPLIIDCGAHIGISVLFFKSLYPESKIIAFEPDINSFRLLKKNMEINQFTDVEIYNYAISDFQGETIFYGDFSKNSESVGNSINKDWGKRDFSNEIKVKVRKLSEFISKYNKIDYLKIDTEGTELQIIEDIQDDLHKVENIYVEFHEFQSNKFSFEKILNILKNHFKELKIITVDLNNILESKYPEWTKKNNPIIHIIKARR